MLGVVLTAAMLAYIVSGLALLMGAGVLNAALILLLGGPTLTVSLACLQLRLHGPRNGAIQA